MKTTWFVFSQILLARFLVVQVQTVHTTSVNDAGKCGVSGGGTSVTDGSELDLRDLIWLWWRLMATNLSFAFLLAFATRCGVLSCFSRLLYCIFSYVPFVLIVAHDIDLRQDFDG